MIVVRIEGREGRYTKDVMVDERNARIQQFDHMGWKEIDCLTAN